MSLSIDVTSIVSFLLIMTRLVTVLTVAPPFRGAGIPGQVRVGVAVGVAILVAPLHQVDVALDPASLAVATAYQVLVGAMFGFLIQLLLTVPMIAGSMIDGLAGLLASSLFDPLTATSATPAARFNQMLAMVVLFGIEGHLLVIRGVIRSYEAAPLGGFRLSSMDDVLSRAAGQLLLAAVEIALPALVALLMTEAVLALSARAAPRLNVMIVGFAVKSLVFMLTFALTMPLLINGVAALLDRSLRWAVIGSGG
ncbi:MAG: flagellar biosynthetic protein FliR [Actinomycetota bacterium]